MMEWDEEQVFSKYILGVLVYTQMRLPNHLLFRVDTHLAKGRNERGISLVS